MIWAIAGQSVIREFWRLAIHAADIIFRVKICDFKACIALGKLDTGEPFHHPVLSKKAL